MLIVSMHQTMCLRNLHAFLCAIASTERHCGKYTMRNNPINLSIARLATQATAQHDF
jgi:hypothetical protein